jgi:hypothetical protein
MDDNVVNCLLAVVAVVIVGYLLLNYMNGEQPKVEEEQVAEGFYSEEAAAEEAAAEAAVQAAEALGQNEAPKGLDQQESTQFDQIPSECYPKEVLNSSDLLPNDSNSTWAQAVPSGAGALQDKNFLNAGYHIGINTVGQSLRNANRQLRSEPPNPQTQVSPWLQTTMEPDTSRKPLEIGA